MPIHVISASAGTGKTHRLTELLADRLGPGREPAVRPERVVAVTFTRKAAADLEARARQALLRRGFREQAYRLSGGLVGTVNSVCGRLVARFAFEAGVSPEVRVLDENEAPPALARAMSDALDGPTVRRMWELAYALGSKPAEWRGALLEIVRNIVDAARANGMTAERLVESRNRSIETFLGLFPSSEAPDGAVLDDAFRRAIEKTAADLRDNGDGQIGTAKYRKFLDQVRAQWGSEGRLPWSQWVKLTKEEPGKPSLPATQPVLAAAAQHLRHPGLRRESAGWIGGVFDVAARTLTSYQDWKRERRVMDFVDQEALLYGLLGREDVRRRLAGEIDLLLVDEFQDTSPIQLALFHRLAGIVPESVWVGDPKQAIYAFRGSDPALMQAVLRAAGGEPEILKECRRSRPPLVDLVSGLFADRFLPEIPPSQVVAAPVRPEREGLPQPVAGWALTAKNDGEEFAALAAGVAMLLGRIGAGPVQVEDRESGEIRPIRPGEVAVLCRKNENCRAVAHALEKLGVRAAVRRKGLVETPETVLILAALRRLIDSHDSLAVAEIVSMTAEDPAPEAWLEDRLAHLEAGKAPEAWGEDHAVVRGVDQLRTALGHDSPSEILDAAILATDARRHAMAWGRGPAGVGNLEALRRQARLYEDHSRNAGAAASLAGLVEWLRRQNRAELDEQAEGLGTDAVQVLTYHKAKGLEWPAVVLADLNDESRGRLWEVAVLGDRPVVDVSDPLGGRWIRYWVWPYGPQKTDTGLDTGDTYRQAALPAQTAAEAEDLRLLYVGMTRPRDLLVLTARRDKKGGMRHAWLDKGLAGRIRVPDADGSHSVKAGDKIIPLRAVTCVPLDQAAEPVKAETWVPTPSGVVDRLPARLDASGGLPGPVEARIGEILEVGPRLPLAGKHEMNDVGEAIHAFFAADDPAAPLETRARAAEDLLRRFGVPGSVPPAGLVGRADALRTVLAGKYKITAWRTEWPLQVRAGKQVVSGWADLVLDSPKGWVVVDHKSFPGARELWGEHVLKHAGQLAAYALALEKATGRGVVGRWIHLPVAGGLVGIL